MNKGKVIEIETGLSNNEAVVRDIFESIKNAVSQGSSKGVISVSMFNFTYGVIPEMFLLKGEEFLSFFDKLRIDNSVDANVDLFFLSTIEAFKKDMSVNYNMTSVTDFKQIYEKDYNRDTFRGDSFELYSSGFKKYGINACDEVSTEIDNEDPEGIYKAFEKATMKVIEVFLRGIDNFEIVLPS